MSDRSGVSVRCCVFISSLEQKAQRTVKVTCLMYESSALFLLQICRISLLTPRSLFQPEPRVKLFLWCSNFVFRLCCPAQQLDRSDFSELSLSNLAKKVLSVGFKIGFDALTSQFPFNREWTNLVSCDLPVRAQEEKWWSNTGSNYKPNCS